LAEAVDTAGWHAIMTAAATTEAVSTSAVRSVGRNDEMFRWDMAVSC
jgi:hypothetical protein